MSWTIPDKGEGQNDLQSILFQEYLEVLVDGLAGNNCVLSGGAVTAQGSPDMTVAVAKGAVLTNGVLKPVAAGNVAVGTADATNPRLDLIVVDSSGARQCRAGTAAANPKPPVRTANDVVLAVVYVPAADTTISSDQITDLRVLVTKGPVVVDKNTTPVSFANNSSIQTYYSLTIPNGLLLAGKHLRVRMGGTTLLNSGSPTLTLTISFGGTTLYAGTSAAFTADADRRTWALDILLSADASNSQKLTGIVSITQTGAFTGPTTGLGGWVANGVSPPLWGTSAVDADAADRTLTVQVTMSVANAADDFSREFAVAELL